jgi:hypothetical protein
MRFSFLFGTVHRKDAEGAERRKKDILCDL